MLHSVLQARQPTPRLERQEVVVLRAFGGPQGFELEDRPMPTPGAHEVRVHVLAVSVQFTDVIIREGKYPGLQQKTPMVLGYDVIGEVDSIGTGVHDVRVGDRVAALTVTGSYARYRTLAAKDVVPVSRALDPAEAAALVLSWTTAYQLLHREAKVKPGQRVLVQGAAGAVGQALVSLAKLANLEVWGTARRDRLDLVTSLGATPIDMNAQSPRDFVPGGFDAVFDGIGAHGFSRSLASVKPGGIVCAFGFSDAVRRGGSMLQVGTSLLRLRLWNAFSQKRAHFYSITAMREKHPDWYRADLETLFGLLSKRAIHPRIAERIRLSDVASAHRRIEVGNLDGKIVIVP
jgi:NADPH:quinone reductase-like Zn-dependent oxidoreductase